MLNNIWTDKEATKQIIDAVRNERVQKLEAALTAIRDQTLRDHGYDADCMIDEIMRIAEEALK